MNICTKDNPMPVLPLKGLIDRKKQWEHPDSIETPSQSDNYIRYECPHCECYYYEELPD